MSYPTLETTIRQTSDLLTLYTKGVINLFRFLILCSEYGVDWNDQEIEHLKAIITNAFLMDVHADQIGADRNLFEKRLNDLYDYLTYKGDKVSAKIVEESVGEFKYIVIDEHGNIRYDSEDLEKAEEFCTKFKYEVVEMYTTLPVPK